MSYVAEWGDLIGNTPLLKLSTLSQEYGFSLFAKLEMLNLGGSMKDRPARHMIRMALRDGLIDTSTTIIESSSGNMGIGLALVLLISGAIEGFVTPSGLPTWARIGIGIAAEAAFLVYVYVLGGRAAREGETGDVEEHERSATVPTAA